MSKKETINVQGTEITVISLNNNDYISLTDMAGYKDNLEARIVVSNWMSTYYTIDFLAVWEQVNNPNFNRMGFHTVRNGGGGLPYLLSRLNSVTRYSLNSDETHEANSNAISSWA